MTYLGNNPSTQSFTSGTDYFSGTGSQTAFTLTRTVNSVNDIEVVINNVVQQPSTAYTLSGTTITFTSAPSSGTNNIYVRYLATNMQSFTVPANSVGRSQLTSDLQAVAQGKNKIINGGMTISQRGTSFSGLTSAVYTIDRWKTQSRAGASITVSQVADQLVDNTVMAVMQHNVTTAASDNNTFINQFIEEGSIDLLGKAVTLSFYAKVVSGSATITPSAEVDNGNYAFSGTAQTLTSNWQKFTWTFSLTGYTTSIAYRHLRIVLGINSGIANIQITGVQLEEGTTATSFEREAYSVTLQKCQRYYFRQNFSSTVGQTVAVAQAYGSGQATGGCIPIPVTMRTVPTCSMSSIGHFRFTTSVGGAGNVMTSGTWDNPTQNMISNGGWAGGSGLTAGNATAMNTNTTSAWVDASAEL